MPSSVLSSRPPSAHRCLRAGRSSVRGRQSGGSRPAARVYFAKQNCPGQAHEARLLSALVKIAPEYVVPVVAADPGRDLLLTADVGRTLYEVGGDRDVATWCRIVRDAALLQRAVVPHAEDLGLTEMAPECATTYAGDAIGRLGALPEGDPRRLPEEVAEQLRALFPTIERWSDQVAELDLPLTLNHNDLHAANVVAATVPTRRCASSTSATLSSPSRSAPFSSR